MNAGTPPATRQRGGMPPDCGARSGVRRWPSQLCHAARRENAPPIVCDHKKKGWTGNPRCPAPSETPPSGHAPGLRRARAIRNPATGRTGLTGPWRVALVRVLSCVPAARRSQPVQDISRLIRSKRRTGRPQNNAFGGAGGTGAGGGLLARMDFAETGPGHFHAEASARLGVLNNDYDNDDMRDAFGRRASYDSDSAYYGLHVGAGYVWNLSDKADLDLYARYLWTHQDSDSLSLSTGERLHFDSVDSHRLRLGARFAYTANEYVRPYIGAAWEQEFDGETRATTNGFDIDRPDLEGSTGMGELGITLTPSATIPVSLDLGVQGYVGKREGVSGTIQLQWKF